MDWKKSKNNFGRKMIIKADSFKDGYKDKSREEILDEMYEKYVELEKLKRKLRRYENPHTPPSKERT